MKIDNTFFLRLSWQRVLIIIGTFTERTENVTIIFNVIFVEK